MLDSSGNFVGTRRAIGKPIPLAAVAEAAASRHLQPPVAVVRHAGDAAPPAEVAVFDHVRFAEIEALLPRVDLVRNLNGLIVHSERLLDRLRGAELRPQASELAEAAHRLAGSAGTLGFSAVANAARQFERAADAGAAEMGELAGQLAAAIAAALGVARRQLKMLAAETV